MPKVHILQSNFVTGQLDEGAAARSETALYRNGAAALRNCDPMVAGGVRSRRGSWHCGTLPGEAVIREFSFSLEQSYVVAFSDGRADFYYSTDGTPVASFGGAPWGPNELRELRVAQLGDVMWVVHESFPMREIVRTSASTFILREMVFDGTRGTPTYRYSPGYISAQSGGAQASSIGLAALPTIIGVPTQVWVGMTGQARVTAGPGPWLPFVVTSIAGLLFGITWTGGTMLQGIPIDVQLNGSTTMGGAPGTLLTSIVGATAGTSSPDRILFSEDVLFPTHLNTVLRVYDEAAATYRYATITEVINAKLARVVWDGAALPLGSASLLWEEQAFSPARGYARAVCTYQQRLVFGGAFQAGNLLLMSKSGQFRNFDLGTAKDNDAIAVVGAGGVRTIRHLVEGEYLVIVTENGVSLIEVDVQKPVTPTTIRVKKIAPYGGADAPPWQFDGGVLMVVDGGNTVRDISYSTEAENTTAVPVSLAATDFIGTILDSAVLPGSNARPEQLAFFVNSAGRIVVFHSLREQKIGAWFEWSTDGLWTSVCVAGKVPYAVCRRGSTWRLERFDLAAPFDAQIGWGGPQPRTLPMVVGHLPDFAVAHAVDTAGDYLGGGTVFGGQTRVTRQLEEVGDLGTGSGVIGLGFGWWIDPLPPAVDLPDGTMLDRYLRVLSTALRLYRTQAAEIEGDMLVLQRDPLDVAAVPDPVTRWWRVKHLGWARPNGEGAPAVRRITRSVPLPVTVLAIKREVKV